MSIRKCGSVSFIFSPTASWVGPASMSAPHSRDAVDRTDLHIHVHCCDHLGPEAHGYGVRSESSVQLRLRRGLILWSGHLDIHTAVNGNPVFFGKPQDRVLHVLIESLRHAHKPLPEFVDIRSDQRRRNKRRDQVLHTDKVPNPKVFIQGPRRICEYRSICPEHMEHP